jgi:GNAT superfamily N-acetyltransferase
VQPGSGFTVRTATREDAGSIAAVHVASWRSTYREILPAELLSALSVDRRTEAWRGVLKRGEGSGEGSVLVATASGGDVLGFCHVGPNRGEPLEFKGEVYAIYLLTEMQGRGLGRELFARGTEWLRAHDRRSLLVWVLASNSGARRFYERLGGRRVAEKPIEIGSHSYVEVAYGWS